MPRAGLTALRVVQEAERIADHSGFEHLTLAAVAAGLGVRVPSLYKHVAGLPELRRQIEIRAKAEIGGILARATAGKAGHDALVAFARAYRDWAREHPGRYASILHGHEVEDAEVTEVTMAVLSIISATLSHYGLTGDDEIDAVRIVRASLHGFVSLELAAGFRFPHSADHSFDTLVQALSQTLSNWPPGGPPPHRTQGPDSRSTRDQ